MVNMMRTFFHKWFNFGKSVFVLTLIPIIFTAIFSLVYSHTYVEQIPLAVLDLDQTTVSRSIVQSFEDSTGFHVALWSNSEEEMKKALLSGEVKVGLILSADLEEGIKFKQSPRVLVLIEGANIFVGNSAYSYAANILGTLNIGIQANVLDAGGLMPFTAEQNLKTLSFTDRVLYVPQMGNFVYAFAGFLGIFIQQTFMSVLSPVLLDRRLSAVAIAKEGAVYAMLTFIAFLACLLIAHHMGGYPLRGGLLSALLVQLVFLLDLAAITIFITVFFSDTSNCIQFIMLLSIPTFLTSGYIWPEFAMPPHFAAAVKAIWPLHYYAIPLREIMLKGVGLAEVASFLKGGLIFAAVWFPLALILRKIKILKMTKNYKFED